MTGQAIAVPVAAVLAGIHETRCDHCTTSLHVALPKLADVLGALVAQPAEWPPLTDREASIARILLGLRGEWVRGDVLLQAVFGPGFSGQNVRVHTSRLRVKLAPLGWRVENRPGVGWCLLGPEDGAPPVPPEPLVPGRRCPDCGGRKSTEARRCAWCLRKLRALAA